MIFFFFNGVGKHAYNYLLSHIEISWHLSWRNQVRKGISLMHPKFLDGLNHESKGEDSIRKRSWAHSLAHNTSGVEGHVRASGWDEDDRQAVELFTQTCTNQTTSWLVQSWNTFGARTSHRQTWTHKIHHDLDSREATTFPLIVFSMPDHGANTQMSFCSGTPKWESRNSWNWDFCNFRGT